MGSSPTTLSALLTSISLFTRFILLDYYDNYTSSSDCYEYRSSIPPSLSFRLFSALEDRACDGSPCNYWDEDG
jgi:hypothetical protein